MVSRAMALADYFSRFSRATKLRFFAAVLAGVLLALFYRQIDVAALRALALRLNGPLVFFLLTVLPLAGFPVSVLHVIAGVRFGAKLGILLVAASILLQLLTSYAIVQIWRVPLERRLSSVRRKIPHGAHGAVSLFTILLPGVPYFAKNYVLPLIGVPLGTYLAWCFPLHVIRSSVAIFFGDQSDELTPMRWAAFGLYALGIMASSWWAYRRLRGQFENQPREEDGPTRLE